MTPDEYERLLRKIKQTNTDIAQAEGAYKQIMKDLEENYGISNIEEAEKELTKMEKEQEKGQAALDRMLEEFKEKWGDRLIT